jgi:IclR family transcriptional regulator, pca regulon regulatory protein
LPKPPGPPRPENSKSLVLSLAKGFRVLEVFDSGDPELTLAQIAQKADLDAGTTHRILKTLVMLGYLRQTPATKRYSLSLKVLDLGFHAIARMDFQAGARPILRSLVGELNEAASVGVLDGGEIIYIERVHAGHFRLGVDIRIGTRIPAYCTALGYAILAHLPLDQRMHVLGLRDRVRLTPRTPVTIPDIERRLDEVRELGYALSDQDSVHGLRVVAAPILDPDGHPYGGVSVTSPTMASSLEDFVANSSGPVVRASVELGRILRLSGASAPAIQKPVK